MLRRQMEWVARVKNSGLKLQRMKVLWKSLWKMNLQKARVSLRFIKVLKTGQNTKMPKLKENPRLSYLKRRKRLHQLRIQVPELQEPVELSLILQIQINRARLVHLQPQVHQMASSSQTMVGFADNAKIITSLVELTVTGVRSVKMLRTLKESHATS